MNSKKTWKMLSIFLAISMLAVPLSQSVMAAPAAAPASPVTFTILHTNDFHGQLETSGSNPGMARTATVIEDIRTAKGTDNVLLVDAGDEMQGSLLSNLGDATPDGKGLPTIATYNAMSYDVATFGNHEFDWGQAILTTRTGGATGEANYPYVTANIVKNDTGNCATAGWIKPDFADAPYQIITVGGAAPNTDTVKVGFIGVTTTETPSITVSTATTGLCFKDPADSILHYYDAMKTDGADVIVVLSHLGFEDGGYGYGVPVYGDKSLAAKLNTAGKPANLIIGGHSHTDVGGPAPAPAVATIGATTVTQAHYNGRKVGQADITVGTNGSVTVAWTRLVVSTSGAEYTPIKDLITTYATDPDYVALRDTPVGYSTVDLPRLGGSVDNMMGTFIDDAIYGYLNEDADTTNDIDIFFNNAGGIRTDWCFVGGVWVNTGCAAGTHAAGLLTYGNMFTILPFGNLTVVGRMTGAQILEVINWGPTQSAGVIQPAGLKFKYFKYVDAIPTAGNVWAWGAFDVQVWNKTLSIWEPLDLEKTYNVGTNEFLAPGGGDKYYAFKYMSNVTYLGDMLNYVNSYVNAHHGTAGTAYDGPSSDGTLDGRILRDGNGNNTYDTGEIVPLTILHHNDSHGNLDKTSYVGYTQLATQIKQERLHNPTRTLLLSSGDNIQGDAMSYYFKTAPTGFTSDGTVITDPSMHIQPLIKAFNAMNYDAMTLGNHEFNFGSAIFTDVLSQATFPLLQANVTEDPGNPYGLAAANIQPYVEKNLGDIDIAIIGIGNHRVPNYELPSNIPGLSFSDPIAKAQELSSLLGPTNDVVIALTHIGFTENPSSVEVDLNVDTNLVAQTTGIDAVIGGHSHTDPAVGFGSYKYLPSIIADADGNPVAVAQAYRYNNTLGEVIIGLRDIGGGNYEVVSQTGRYIKPALADPEDAEIDAIVTPYTTMLSAYNNTAIGTTTTPIDTTNAYVAETNAANLQADAAIYELASQGITDVDFHLSGAMTRPGSVTNTANWVMFPTATVDNPANIKISDMFTLMPYENSLVVLSMNGPQLKVVLERAYRNYYYYKHVIGYGGYSWYTTCMIDTNAGNVITYNDLNPTLPSGNNVVSLNIGGVNVDFADAATYYNVSTVNYLAAGSCNFNDNGVSLWPLDQIVHDTQYYVRDAVIDYTTHMGTVSPAIEGRLAFVSDPTAPTALSSTRAGINPTNAASVDFTVTFSEVVSGVDTADFGLTSTGTLSGAVVTGVSGSGTTYTVTISTGTGAGTLRLDILNTADIEDLAANPLSGLPYTAGQAYDIRTQIFADVLPSYWAYPWIERLYKAGITGGCSTSPLSYCPENSVTRAQIAVFLLKGINGSSYTPPAASGTVFSDVPTSHWAAAWIEQLAEDGITGGCGAGTYCPEQPVTRAQMAVFLLKAKYGSAYLPPSMGDDTGFADVPVSHWAAAWIKQLAAEGITSGCSAGNYCPDQSVTRAQMAVFLVKTFELP